VGDPSFKSGLTCLETKKGEKKTEKENLFRVTFNNT